MGYCGLLYAIAPDLKVTCIHLFSFFAAHFEQGTVAQSRDAKETPTRCANKHIATTAQSAQIPSDNEI